MHVARVEGGIGLAASRRSAQVFNFGIVAAQNTVWSGREGSGSKLSAALVCTQASCNGNTIAGAGDFFTVGEEDHFIAIGFCCVPPREDDGDVITVLTIYIFNPEALLGTSESTDRHDAIRSTLVMCWERKVIVRS